MAAAGAAKTVFIVRHGQAEHNVLWDTDKAKAVAVRDPALTDLGKAQAADLMKNPVLARAFASGPAPEVCVVSPLHRTLQTAWIGLQATDVPFVACGHFQECSSSPCDTGRDIATMQELMPRIDFAGVADKDKWFEKTGHVDFLTGELDQQGLAQLRERCRVGREYLLARPESTIVLVAHHTLFAHMFDLELFNCEVVKLALSPGGGHTVLEADGEVVDLYTATDDRWTWSGSNPLRGTLKTCERMAHLGPAAAAATKKHL